MLFKVFDVSPEYVQIDEDVFVRPKYIGASQWVEFWEDAKAEHNYIEDLEADKDDLERQVSRLESDIEELEQQINGLEDTIYEIRIGAMS